MSELSKTPETGVRNGATPDTATMLELAWNSARAWAMAARQQQSLARRQALWTLILVALAAVLAAIVGATGESPATVSVSTPAVGTLPFRWTTVVSVIAGLLATVGALWGQYVQQGLAERLWFVTRAAAESIQSECYCYAGTTPVYAGAPNDAAKLFNERVSAASQAARKAGALRGNAAPSTERLAPSIGMNADWYRQHRLMQQRDWYGIASARHASAGSRLRRIAFVFGVLAAIFGFAGAVNGLAFVAAGVGAVTTIAGSVAAFSNVDRNAQLATRYSEMVEALESLLGQHRARLLTDAELIDHGETLLTAEYAAWQQLMLKQQAAAI
jgi:hypothetical protein